MKQKPLQKRKKKVIKAWALTHKNTVLINDGMKHTIFRTRAAAKKEAFEWNKVVKVTITYE